MIVLTEGVVRYRVESVVYVDCGDGILHSFDTSSCNEEINPGDSVIATTGTHGSEFFSSIRKKREGE